MSVDINNNPKTKEVSTNSDGVIESTIKTEANNAIKEKSPTEKVAIHSTRNVYWAEVGEVQRGYNIVTRAVADKWLARNHIRIATPEEVAKEYGL